MEEKTLRMLEEEDRRETTAKAKEEGFTGV